MSITSLGADLSHEEPHKLAHRKLSDSSSELILWGDNGCLLLKSDLLSLTGTCYTVECPTEQTDRKALRSCRMSRALYGQCTN